MCLHVCVFYVCMCVFISIHIQCMCVCPCMYACMCVWVVGWHGLWIVYMWGCSWPACTCIAQTCSTVVYVCLYSTVVCDGGLGWIGQ